MRYQNHSVFEPNVGNFIMIFVIRHFEQNLLLKEYKFNEFALHR